MQQHVLRHGDVVEVRSPTEILATLDDGAMLDGLPFMPEMLGFIGRCYVVDKRAEKVCDTINYYTSRRLPDTVLLEDLRCDGAGHDGCQAECRIFWKEAWLRRVEPGEPHSPIRDEAAFNRLAELVTASTRAVGADGVTRYRCQATEMFRASRPLRTLDPLPYVREYSTGNVGVGTFLRVAARAAVTEPLRKLGMARQRTLPGSNPQPARQAPLNLQPGELVQVKSREEIAETLNLERKNRGLYFDVDEMFPFCGGTYRVRQRVNSFIDDKNGEMIHLKTDTVTLEGVVCSGERSTARWFCPREIYPYWREAWLRRVDAEAAEPDNASVATRERPTVASSSNE